MQGSMLASPSGHCLTFSRPTAPRLQPVFSQHNLHARRLGCYISSRRRLQCHAASNTSNGNSFAQKAQEFAETAQQRLQDFVQQQKLEEKAAAAASTAKEKLTSAYEETEENVRRTYMKLESEHNIRERVDRISKSVSETVRDIDQEYSVRRRLKSAYDDAKRMFPVWKRQFTEFSSTQFGKVSLTLLFVALLFSGLLWQILNVFWLLWWVSVPVSLYLTTQNKKAAEQQAASSASQSPFGSRWGGSSRSSSSSGNYGASDGPVVDAEWVSLDDDGSSSRRRR